MATTIKVQILDECEHCQGEAYMPIGEAVSYTGELYIRYKPCRFCEGTGEYPRWITISELIQICEKESSLELASQFSEEFKPVNLAKI